MTTKNNSRKPSRFGAHSVPGKSGPEDGAWLITLPPGASASVRTMTRALKKIYGAVGHYTFITLALYKNGRVKKIYAFSEEMVGG